MVNAMTSDSASRVTRSRRAFRLILYPLVAGAGLATVLHAQDQAPQPEHEPAATPAPTDKSAPAATPATEPPAQAKTPAPAGEQAGQAGTATPPAGTATPAATTPGANASDDDTRDESAPVPKGSSPNHFEPTEKVRADFDVSFPVDI